MPPETATDWPASKVRETFIRFFQERGHQNHQSSPVVPSNDPTRLFANADTYHHTFFEMLGNWSFGDYFKDQAIQWAWELLTQVYKLPEDRIYVTYFGGDEESSLEADDETRDIWLNFLPPDRVLPFGCKDNFWEMGDTGPRGPCTEIHFDRIGKRDAASLVNNDDPTCIEIWNLVFIQFNRQADGCLKHLPSKHVDTGMGLERLTSILQNKMSNYDTDLFMPIFDAIQQATGARRCCGKVGADDVDKIDMAYRVVADHIRTLSFTIADGSCPGNEGREFVVRRILRRALHYGSEVLKGQVGFFSGLVRVVAELMGDVFPEQKCHQLKIRKVIADEEICFGRTLLKGIEKFNKAVQDLQGNPISGQDAFRLWESYGFPLDLTQLMAKERGLVVDVKDFNEAMAEARDRSRSVLNKQLGGAIYMDVDATSELHKRGVSPTDDNYKFVWHKDHENAVKAIYNGAEYINSASVGDKVGIVLETTSFHAEQGGQISDIGSITCSSGSFEVCDVQVFGGFVIHTGSFAGETGKISVGDKVTCKEVLGPHVDQMGSIVLPEKLRFDFTHGKPIPPNDLGKLSQL
ncbi:hypothetical protein C5167_047954 [Papaver somniferum]|uniref:Alanine--tRNA ligase n=1 Tax=Papaver somniferum TaxID=3469 RepID=A0A4Y7KGJ1_PAPSO|nr:hypothetical protein C5167_047954 [Papaver somniferum]